MARSKWSKEIILEKIRAHHERGENLTCSNMKKKDSKLVGAAVSYFGNWGAAIRKAGLNYDEVRKRSKNDRAEHYRKWTREKVLEKIRQVAEIENDISYVYVKEKYSSLVAAANNYFGSWKKAIEILGYNYSEVQRDGRANRQERDKVWRRRLLLERFRQLPVRDEKLLREMYPVFHRVLIENFGSWGKVSDAVREVVSGDNK